jgi:DNA primase
LDKSLRAHLKRITDPSIRSHYGEDIKQLRYELFGQRPRSTGPARAPFRPFVKGQRPIEGPQLPPIPSTKQSLLVSAPEHIEEAMRTDILLATLIVHPELVGKFESALERLELSNGAHELLRGLILLNSRSANVAEEIRKVAPADLEVLLSRPHVQSAPCVLNRYDSEFATLCLAGEFAALSAHRGARREIEDAVEDLSGVADEGLTWRLSQAALARHRADNPAREDAADLGEDRSALSNHLQNLIDGQVWVKKKR